MCFRVTTTATLSHSCPTICSVEKLCTNAKRCRNVWIDREIVNATENSISVLVQVGRLPFAAMLKTTVAEVVAGNRSDSKTYVVDTLPRNGQLVTEIDGLHPNCWYRIQTCVHIPTPYMFTAANVRLPRESVFCLEDEAVRTSKIEYSWNRKSLARSVNPPLLLFFFTALLLTSCIQLL
ncbi:unnamed protein product [Soboliphyme baturini]|uniref:DUF5727 domain-containing protein n=1 Tax=Soboliphyme baturini TaxID=241478 RepID=A0A183IT62_9BILA|nr:unnamed protein product [Soboliphyme baturini]